MSVGGCDLVHCIPGVDDEIGVVGDGLEIESGVVGGDDDGVLGGEGFRVEGQGGGAGPVHVLASRADDGDMRIVVGDSGAEFLEAIHEREGWRFTHVVDVGLVGETEQQDAAAVDGLGARVECLHGALDDVFRHGSVDLPGELDETCVHAEFAGFPREIVRVDGDAVAAEAGARVEGGEAEGFGGGGADDLPEIDPHLVGGDLELVDESDVHRAVNVFQEFGQLCDLGGGDRDDFLEGCGVKRDAGLKAGRCVTTDDLGDVGCGEVRVARILAFRGIDDEDGFPDLEACGFDTGHDLFLGGAGVGRALEAEDLVCPEMRDDGFERVGHVGEIRLHMFVQGRRDAEDDGVTFPDAGEIGGGIELSGIPRGGDLFRRDMFDVAFAFLNGIGLGGVDIEAERLAAFRCIGEDKWQADVAEADDSHGAVKRGDFLDQ